MNYDQQVLTLLGRRSYGGGVRLLVIATILAGVTLFLLVTYTIKKTQGLPTSWATFGLHPVLMSLAFGLLAPCAAASFRGLEGALGHPAAKTLHAALHSAAFGIGVAGFVNMWIVHARADPPLHFVSVHSWLGFATLIAFGLQWLSGLAVFATPLAERCVTKRGWRPIHIWLGSFSLFGGLLSIEVRER